MGVTSKKNSHGFEHPQHGFEHPQHGLDASADEAARVVAAMVSAEPEAMRSFLLLVAQYMLNYESAS